MSHRFGSNQRSTKQKRRSGRRNGVKFGNNFTGDFGEVVAQISGERYVEIDEEFEDFHNTALGDEAFRRDDEPVKVCMNIVVISLSNVNTIEQSYDMRNEMWVAWNVTREEAEDYIKDPFNFRPKFHPKPAPWTIEIKEEYYMEFGQGRTFQFFMWKGKLMAVQCLLITARYLEAMDLENFPFDCQHLTFDVAIRSDVDIPLALTDRGEIIARDVRSAGGYYNFDRRAMLDITLDLQGCTFNVRNYRLALTEFTFHNLEMEIENMPDDVPFMHCSIRLERNAGPYVFRVFFTMFVLLAVATLGLQFPKEVHGDRLAYVSTSMLTVVAFLFIIQQWLPNLTYLTLVDRYMLFAFTYMGGLGAQVVVLERLGLEETELEDQIFYINLAAIIVLHILLWVYCRYLIHFEKKKLRMTHKQVDKVYSHRHDKRTGGAAQFIVHSALRKVDEDGMYTGGPRNVDSHGWLFAAKETKEVVINFKRGKKKLETQKVDGSKREIIPAESMSDWSESEPGTN